MRDFAKIKNLFLLFFTAATVAEVLGNEYCTMNCPTVAHIACHHSGLFNRSCSKNAESIEMTPDLKNIFLSLHNENRNLLAGGAVKGLSPACRMATIQWDNELAALARLNTLRCKAELDHCHNTRSFKRSGQNIGLKFTTSTALLKSETEIQKLIQGWFNEVEKTTQAIIDDLSTIEGIEHFIHMAADRNMRLGCACSTYTTDKYYLLIVCNYAVQVVAGSTVYKKCPKAAMNCETGTNPNYPNLCSQRESYNVEGYK